MRPPVFGGGEGGGRGGGEDGGRGGGDGGGEGGGGGLGGKGHVTVNFLGEVNLSQCDVHLKCLI